MERVKLSESKLHKIIKESVKKVINEISIDLANNALYKSENQVKNLDILAGTCHELVEAIDKVFFDWQDDQTTSLSAKIGRELNIEEVRRTIEELEEKLYKILDRKVEQETNIGDYHGVLFDELPDD